MVTIHVTVQQPPSTGPDSEGGHKSQLVVKPAEQVLKAGSYSLSPAEAGSDHLADLKCLEKLSVLLPQVLELLPKALECLKRLQQPVPPAPESVASDDGAPYDLQPLIKSTQLQFEPDARKILEGLQESARVLGDCLARESSECEIQDVKRFVDSVKSIETYLRDMEREFEGIDQPRMKIRLEDLLDDSRKAQFLSALTMLPKSVQAETKEKLRLEYSDQKMGWYWRTSAGLGERLSGPPPPPL